MFERKEMLNKSGKNRLWPSRPKLFYIMLRNLDSTCNKKPLCFNQERDLIRYIRAQ